MRNTKQQLIKEITALDLAVRLLRQETHTLRRSVVTIKKAMNAPLTTDETNWLQAQPAEDHARMIETARLINAALKPASSTTSTAPLTQQATVVIKPAKKTRKRSSAPARNQRWTDKEDKALMRMVKIGQTPQQISYSFGRSVGAIQQRIKILKGKQS